MGKRKASVTIEPDHVKKRNGNPLDYTKCLICQEHDKQKLFNITDISKEKLVIALECRQDLVYDRIYGDICSNDSSDWLSEKSPKWHSKCRNYYINEKGYTLAKKKRLGTDENVSASIRKSEQTFSRASTRSDILAFDAKSTCVICSEKWKRSHLPDCNVSTVRRQQSIIKKAKALGRDDILTRIVGAGHDMVANDICYHIECMNLFMATRVRTDRISETVYDVAFTDLVSDIHDPLLKESQAFSIKALTCLYRQKLSQLGVKTANRYAPDRLAQKLAHHFDSKVTILKQHNDHGFICGSHVSLGEAMSKLSEVEDMSESEKQSHVLKEAAKLIREDCKKMKSDSRFKQVNEISLEACDSIVPDSLYNLLALLINDKADIPEGDMKRVKVDQMKHERILISAQQILQNFFGIKTPLSVAVTYHIYNQTRSKALIMLANRLGLGISYDILQRDLTALTIQIKDKITNDGVYIPDNMSQTHDHVFAMDNLDWKNKTLEGGSFHATTAIIIEQGNASDDEPVTCTIPKCAPTRRKSTPSDQSENSNMSLCIISDHEKRKSRALSDIESLESLQTVCDDSAWDALLIWRLGRFQSSSRILSSTPVENLIFPGFSAFCAQCFSYERHSNIGYLTLLPHSPTDPKVLKEEMVRLVKISHALGDRYTIITGDQLTYELSTAIRSKYQEDFANVILLLGGFHTAHNFIKALCKIMRDAGAEEILVKAGLFTDGTVKKVFGEKSDYYQTLHALRILNEAMWRLFWIAFEQWVPDEYVEVWRPKVESTLHDLFMGDADMDSRLAAISQCVIELSELREQLDEFKVTLKCNLTAQFWLTFLDMSDILIRFIFYEREADFTGHLCEAALMLPYLAAAGHYKYAQQSLPLYLHEMKHLPKEVHRILSDGCFVGRRLSGIHNAVSPDMLLEQTYNANAKEAGGLDGKTLTNTASEKWVYTKPTLAAVSAQLRDMLHMQSDNAHHESGYSRVAKDADLVERVQGAVEKDIFVSNAQQLINISNGQCASPVVSEHLCNVKGIGIEALRKSLASNTTKTSITKLQTFHSQNNKKKKTSKKKVALSGRSEEVTALLRITQVIASGAAVDVKQCIGEHECHKVPPSLFGEDGSMRTTGNKASLVKAVKDITHVKECTSIPSGDRKIAVVTDAMNMVRRLSFKEGETFGAVAQRYGEHLVNVGPPGTVSIHFCCDDYGEVTIKSVHSAKRYDLEGAKGYDIADHYQTPSPDTFFPLAENKQRLLAYLCENWSAFKYLPDLGTKSLILGGGFESIDTTVMIRNGQTFPIAELESTQPEADTRIILHAIYCAQKQGMDCIIIMSNDTDVIVMLIYYGNTLLKCVPELWINSALDTYLPIHEIVNSLGPQQCRVLPFIHSISGRDTTSFPYNTGKKAWLVASGNTDVSALVALGEETNDVTEEVTNQARQLVLEVYSRKQDDFSGSDLCSLRMYKFLNSKSVLMKVLPPTEDAFLLHLKRAAYATIVDKNAHRPKPNLPSVEGYGWSLELTEPEHVLLPTPVPSTRPPWPTQMPQTHKCGCVKGCGPNCSCRRNGLECYIGCRCQGNAEKCTWARELADAECSESDNESADNESESE